MPSAQEIGRLFATLGLDSRGFDDGMNSAGKKFNQFEKRINSSTQVLDKRMKASLQNLSFQINDVATSLASGGSLFQVFAQQAGQFVQVFQQGGGVKAVLGATAQSIKGMITPARLATAGFVALGLGAIYLVKRASDIETSIKGADVALRGMGTSALASGKDVQQSIKDLRGLGIAADDARDAVNKVIRTPGLNPAQSTSMVATGANLGAIRGTGTEGGTDELIKAIKGGPEALIELGRELDKISPKEATQIRLLRENKGSAAALNEAYRLLAKGIEGSSKDSIGPAAEAWTNFKNKLDDFLNNAATGNAIKNFTNLMGELLDRLRSVLGTFGDIFDAIEKFGKTTRGNLRDAIGGAITSVTNAGDRATEGARANRAEMDAALATRGGGRFYTEGMEKNTEGLKRLSDILEMAAKSLPEGFSVVATSGIRKGSGGSLHTSGNAVDVQIVDANGNRLPNKGPVGSDAGYYQTLAKAAYNANQSLYPGAPLTWGGRFETSAGSGMADWMHFDVGQDRGRFGPPLATLAGGAASPSGSIVDTKSKADLIEKQRVEFGKLNAALRQRGLEEIRATALIQARAKADDLLMEGDEKERYAQEQAAQAVEVHRIALQKQAADQKYANDNALKAAKLYGTDYVGALQAAAAAEAELAVRNGAATDARTKAAELLNTQAAQAASQSAATIPGLQKEAEAAERLAEALKQSEAAASASDIEAKSVAATHETMAKAMASGSAEAIKLAQAIRDQTTALMTRAATADLSKKFTQQNIDDRKTVEMLQLESSLQFKSSNEIDRQVALLRVKQDVQAAGNSLTQEEVDKRIASVNAIYDANAALERNKNLVADIKEVGTTLAGSFETVFDTITDGTFKFKDAMNTIIKDLGRLFIRQGFNSLLGGSTGDSILGGIGSLLGFSGGGAVASNYGGITKFADGGSFDVGGAGSIDSKIVSFAATPGEKVNVTKGGGRGGGSGEVIHIQLNPSEGWVSGVADRQIQTRSGAIVRVAVKESQDITRRNFNAMADESQARRA